MKKAEKVLITISTIFLILFILILISLVIQGPLKLLDLKINAIMPSIQTPDLVNISKAIGLIIDPDYMVPISLFLSILIWFFYSKKEGVFLFISMLISAGLIVGLKETIRIARPENSLIENSFLSFPSGHTAIIIVLLGIFCYWIIKSNKNRLEKYLAILISSIILGVVSFSRIYLNAHWFSDILAGFCLGAIVLTASLFIRIRYFNKNIK